MAHIINKAFAKHEALNINTRVPIALPKPGKPKGPSQNLRPVTFIKTLQKALSTIVKNSQT